MNPIQPAVRPLTLTPRLPVAAATAKPAAPAPRAFKPADLAANGAGFGVDILVKLIALAAVGSGVIGAAARKLMDHLRGEQSSTARYGAAAAGATVLAGGLALGAAGMGLGPFAAALAGGVVLGLALKGK